MDAGMKDYKWHIRYLTLAKEISTWSKDPSTKVGAVIVSPKNEIIATGFNGFPRKCADDSRLQDRSLKHGVILHAEVNAILTAARDLTDHTIYVWPIQPCSNCASIIIQSGITKVISEMTHIMRFEPSFTMAKCLFNEAKVDLHLFSEGTLAYEHQRTN